MWDINGNAQEDRQCDESINFSMIGYERYLPRRTGFSYIQSSRN